MQYLAKAKAADEIILRRSVRHTIGAYERRAAERYEDHGEFPEKQAQRDEVAEWLKQHHEPAKTMKVLSLPDKHWTFENQLNDRPQTFFLGLQRDLATFERSVPWMPNSNDLPLFAPENRAVRITVTSSIGDLRGWERGRNRIIYVWAGTLLSYESIGRTKKGGALRGKSDRGCTAVWLDFTANICPEVIRAVQGTEAFLGGKNPTVPAVFSFLAARDKYASHGERVARVLLALQTSQWPRGWRFRFAKSTLHQGSSPYLSIFGTFRHAQP